MKIRELMEAVAQNDFMQSKHQLYDFQPVVGPYVVAAGPDEPFMLYKKTVDTDDPFEPAYKQLGIVPGVSARSGTWPEAVAAAKQMIQGMREDWQKANRRDKTDGMSKKAVKAYRRENPGSKLQTAVTTKPSKLKKGSKAAKRRKSFCARMRGNKGPMKDEKGRPTPKAKALSRWNCEE